MALHLAQGITTLIAIYPLASRELRLWLKQRWSRQLIGMLGIRISQPASPDSNAAMLVCNHVSWLDIFVINAIAPSAFVSKDDVRSWPVIGWMSSRTDTIFIERGSRRAAQRTSEHLNDCLREGKRVAVFPEGTTSDGRGVLPFHSALMQAAVETGCEIQPVALRYLDGNGQTSTTPAYVGDTTLWQSIKAIASAHQLSAAPLFLAPVSARGTDRRHLAATLHRHIAHALSTGRIHPA